MPRTDITSAWPPLPYEAWRDTCATLHLWLQIVGKIALAQSPWINHSWHVTLHTTARGLSTRLLGYGASAFQVEFDFVDHRLVIRVTDGSVVALPLEPQPTATFYRKIMDTLAGLSLPIEIRPIPCELPDPVIPFDADGVHASYDPEYVSRYWRILVQANKVFEEFRARFIGKSSPVHFFWGAPDLAVTRFSGRTAPPHPGGVPHLPDRVTREAYSHEVSSAGFWAGGDQFPKAMFYSYAYPEPPGFAEASVSAGSYDTTLKEFVLPYDDVRRAASPETVLLDFLQSTYDAAADRGGWDRRALERSA